MSAPASTTSNGRLAAAQRTGSQHIAASWGGRDGGARRALKDIDGLLMQEPAKQGPYKLSYYTPEDWDRDALLPEIEQRSKATASPPT
jgi:hypothetical protein